MRAPIQDQTPWRSPGEMAFRARGGTHGSGSVATSIGLAIGLAAILMLIAPAIWNRFPLIEYDSGGYLARWFEGYLVPNRSTTYGLFFAAGWPLDFWPEVVCQAAVAVWTVWLVLRAHGITSRPGSSLAIFIVLAIATTLPWIASVLLTDIFLGPAVLALYLLVRHTERLGRGERAGLVFLIAFAVSTHTATFLVIVGLWIVMAAATMFDRVLVPRHTVARVLAAIVLGTVMLLTANYAISKRFGVSPGGYGIVFGRLLEDGIVKRYLDDHCPDPTLVLCSHRSEINLTADEFLWGKSVFDQLGRFDGLGNEMRRIVLESLVEYPGMQLKAALIAIGRQLLFVKSGEGVVNTVYHTYGMMETFTPSVVPAMRAARQQHDEIRFEAINLIHVPVALGACALLPILAIVGWRRRRLSDVGLLASIVLLALLANAAICSVLSNPHDRYGARIAWVAPFVVLLLPFSRLRGDPDE